MQIGSLLKRLLPSVFLSTLLVPVFAGADATEPFGVSGIYPHLAMTNKEGECGTGAVVPWAGRLWVVTYGPHCPCGSSDKLYEIKPDLSRVIRPESVGGTHAERLIHRESGKLFIGTYLVSSTGGVEYVWISRLPGRLTGAARHLTDPAHKIYVTDMEEALYELDVTDPKKTFTYIRDGFNRAAFQAMFKRWHRTPPPGWNEAEESTLFGYHGKGTCSGFGKVFYANNGQSSPQAMRDPRTPAGCLASWQPGQKNWELIRTNQFTEVTTRDGIYGNEHPDKNPIWALGWDHRSVLLTTTDDGQTWHDFRLPKGSHSYDGAHGWHTEWPRIREVGTGDDFLATMHGTFWKFPATFSPKRTAGIRPHATYLKVVGDFCRWGARIVCGCDDHAKTEFTNVRDLKGRRAKPRPSESNLWFLKPEELDALGPRVGHGAVWADDAVVSGRASDPFLFAGYDRKWVWTTLRVRLEFDVTGEGVWTKGPELPSGGHDLSRLGPAEWIRLVPLEDASHAFAVFHYGSASTAADANALTVAAPPEAKAIFEHDAPVPTGKIGADAASLFYEEKTGGNGQGRVTRWRLPRLTFDTPATCGRICREVATERDLLHVGGIFYDLPAVTAGGFKYVKAVSATPRAIDDYDTWKGLLVVREAGACKVGALDDVWKLGAPRGVGGPWKETSVTAGEASDPYLMNGFQVKELTLAASAATTVTLEADIDGCGTWVTAGTYALQANARKSVSLPRAFSAYWVRVRSSKSCKATAQFIYAQEND